MTQAVTVFVFCLVRLLVPRSCPAGWYVEGVRPTGASACRPAPPPNCGEPKPPHDQPCPKDGRVRTVGVLCFGAAQPVVVDCLSLGCR